MQVEILTDPPGARISINGGYVGESPVRYDYVMRPSPFRRGSYEQVLLSIRATPTRSMLALSWVSGYAQAELLAITHPDDAPKRVFLDMGMAPIAETPLVDVDVHGGTTTNERPPAVAGVSSAAAVDPNDPEVQRELIKAAFSEKAVSFCQEFDLGQAALDQGVASDIANAIAAAGALDVETRWKGARLEGRVRVLGSPYGWDWMRIALVPGVEATPPEVDAPGTEIFLHEACHLAVAWHAGMEWRRAKGLETEVLGEVEVGRQRVPRK
ncbi:MAG: PEGA domain-containing protein [Bacteroidota bacterium]